MKTYVAVEAWLLVYVTLELDASELLALRSVRLSPRERATEVPIGEEAGRAPQGVWMLQRVENSHACAEN
jgi:hypothetical protein